MELASTFYRFLRFLCFACLSVLCVVVAGGVVFRYVFHNTIHWVTELSTFLFIWIVFVGATIAYRENQHIRLTLLIDKLRGKPNWLVSVLASLTEFSFFGFLTYTGLQMVISTMTSDSEALKIPYGLVYLCVPFTSLLMGLHSSKELVGKMRQARLGRGPL